MKKHYPNFDWLRLLLACEVVLSHIWGRGGLHAFPMPFLAVPSFLAISGFMILQSWRTSSGPGHFWIKRATRLLPAFILSFCLIYLLFDWQQVKQSFMVYLSVGRIGFDASMNPPLWSLSAEELIYVALALTVGLLSVRNLKAALTVAFTGYILLSGVVNLGGREGDKYMALIPAFILGLYARESGYRIPFGAPLLLVFSEALAIANDHYRFGAPLLFALWNCASMLAVIEIGRARFQAPRLPFDVSYGVYIYHYPILLFMMAAGIHGTALYVELPAAVAVAIASALLVERPTLASRERLATWSQEASKRLRNSVKATLQRRSRTGVAFLLVLSAVGFAAAFLLVRSFYVDDALISMRYARNLALGRGLVFNTSGPRVEGYSNFLLVLIEAVMQAIGLTSVKAVQWFLLGTGVTLVAVLAKFFQFRHYDGRVGSLGIGALGLITGGVATPLVVWTAGGLETTLFTLLVTVAVICHIQFLERGGMRALTIGQAAAALACLARPEGFLVFGICAAFCAVAVAMKARTLRDLWPILASMALLAAYGCWKLQYFGSLLPATYFAKAGHISIQRVPESLPRLLEFLEVDGMGIVVAIILGLSLRVRSSVAPKLPLLLLGAILLSYLGYLLCLGLHVQMDFALRLYAPLAPLVALALWEASRLAPMGARWSSACSLAIPFVLVNHFGALSHVWSVNRDWFIGKDQPWSLKRYANAESRFESVVEWLRLTKAKSVALQDAGYIPYELDVKIIDLVGLNDSFIAQHIYMRDRTSDAVAARRLTQEMTDYVIDQHPDVLLQDRLNFMRDPAASKYFVPSGVQFSLNLVSEGDYVIRPFIWNPAVASRDARPDGGRRLLASSTNTHSH